MTKAKQAGGRPRDSRVDHAITASTLELLATQGYASLTVDAVAAHAGVSKTAIYRRYATKQEMIFAAALHGRAEAPPPDSGSLRSDLTALADTIAEQLLRPHADTIAGLISDVHRDAALAARFAGSFVAAERGVVTELLDRAVARGELPTRPDPARVHAMLLGPVFAWLVLLVEDRDQTRAVARAAADTVATALLAAG